MGCFRLFIRLLRSQGDQTVPHLKCGIGVRCKDEALVFFPDADGDETIRFIVQGGDQNLGLFNARSSQIVVVGRISLNPDIAFSFSSSHDPQD